MSEARKPEEVRRGFRKRAEDQGALFLGFEASRALVFEALAEAFSTLSGAMSDPKGLHIGSLSFSHQSLPSLFLSASWFRNLGVFHSSGHADAVVLLLAGTLVEILPKPASLEAP